MKGLAVGRIVHYIPGDSMLTEVFRNHYAAIVTRVVDKERGVINIMAFADKHPVAGGFSFRESVPYSETPGLMTWHWPEIEDEKEVPAKKK